MKKNWIILEQSIEAKVERCCGQPKYGGRFPRVFGDEFGEKFGEKFSDSLNLVKNVVTILVMNLVNHHILCQIQ